MMDKNLLTGLGALTGLVSMAGMIRLIEGAGLTSAFSWVFLLLAMVPWIVYAAWRARHGTLSRPAALAVLGIDVLGFIGVWLFTLGPVIALAASLVAFAIIWVHDWPQRRARGEDVFVRIEELADTPEHVS
ncbi:hypothetical protein MLP_33010 [Microlunatus phosphovorus NM-1]|uniref:Uncharacterized protein n=2 Tax=Microlunatus phosphovorus TaxID=29405 RepID=F5XM58_MICPN|nr:hypothetical protein MLP_33010 [Microlunatus phosphovorus NM-1]